MADTRTFIMEARKNKSKKDNGDSKKRSNLLKIVMSQISGEKGKDLAESLDSKNLELFKKQWASTSSSILEDVEKTMKGDKNE